MTRSPTWCSRLHFAMVTTVCEWKMAGDTTTASYSRSNLRRLSLLFLRWENELNSVKLLCAAVSLAAYKKQLTVHMCVFVRTSLRSSGFLFCFFWNNCVLNEPLSTEISVPISLERPSLQNFLRQIIC